MIKILLRGLFFILLTLPALVQAQQPSTISGLQLWLDAADVTGTGTNPANGTTVTTWKDKSAQHHDAVQANGQSAGVLASSSINGLPAMHFTRNSVTSGTVYRVSGMDIRATTNPSVTIVTVYKQGVRSGDQGLWGDDNGNWDRFYFTSWSGNASAGADNGGASLGPTNPAAIVKGAGIQGLTRLLTAVYDHGVNNGSAIYFNGQVVTTFTDQTDPVAAQSGFYIGFDGDDNPFNGDVAEVMVYNRKLTACEQLQVNRYLSLKYGVVFSSVAVTASGPTTFTEGQTVTLTGSVTGSYQWLRNGVAIAGATNQSYQAVAAGDYKIIVSNSGCADTSAAVTVATTPVTMTAPGNALALDGTNDYINADTLLPASYTKEAWVLLQTSNPTNPILSGNASGATSHAFGAPPTAGSPILSAGHNGVWNQVKDTVALSTGRWYHVAVTYDAATTTMRLYKNGALIAENKNVAPFAGSKALLLGGFTDNGANRVWGGRLDEVRVYASALPQATIQADMYGAAPLPASLVAYYNFDEGVAGGNNVGTIVLIDRSAGQHHALLQNFALNAGSSSNWVESYAMVMPVTTAATNIQVNQFTANWTASTIGTAGSYVLDVSDTISFTNLLPGYSALTVTGLSQVVTGLKAGVTYYYRVRADKPSVTGQGTYSVTTKALTTVPSVDLTATAQVLCNGGTTGALKATFAGGTADYTMKWYKNATVFTNNITTTSAATTTSTATTLGAGTYKVDVLDKGGRLMGTASYQLNDPALLTLSQQVVGISCNNACDAQVTLTAGGGTLPYTYKLGTGAPTGLNVFKNVCAGTYAATVTDNNGCTASVPQIAIVNPAPATLGLASHTDTLLCKNTVLTASAATVAAATYTWTGVNGFTAAGRTINVSTPGMYKVTAVQAGGCTYRDSVNLKYTATEAIPASMILTAHAFINEEVVAVNLTASIPQTQAWTIPAGAQVISQVPEKLVMKFATKGKYEVKLGVGSYDVCRTRDSATVLVDAVADSVSSSNQVILREVSLAPNPTTGPFSLILKLNKSGKVAVRIYSFTGTLAYSTILPDNGLTSITAPVDLSGANKGTYVVVVETANSSEVRKLLLN